MRRGRSLARGTGGCKELHFTMYAALTSGMASRMIARHAESHTGGIRRPPSRSAGL